MPSRKKNAIIYKGHLVLSPEHLSGGNLAPALRVSSFYLEKDGNYQGKFLAGLQETPDIKLKQGYTIYIPSDAREKSDSGKTPASERLCGLLDVFRQGLRPKFGDHKEILFKKRLAQDHFPALQAFSESRVEALLYCPVRPEYHKISATLEAIAPTG